MILFALESENAPAAAKERPLETQKATAMVAFVFLVLWLEVVLFPV
jgi:hypothetical protein